MRKNCYLEGSLKGPSPSDSGYWRIAMGTEKLARPIYEILKFP